MAVPGKKQTRDIGGKHGGQFAKTKGSDFKKFKGKATKKFKSIVTDIKNFKPGNTDADAVYEKAVKNIDSKVDVSSEFNVPPNIDTVWARIDAETFLETGEPWVNLWATKNNGETLPIGQYEQKHDLTMAETDLWDEAKFSAVHEPAPVGQPEAGAGTFGDETPGAFVPDVDEFGKPMEDLEAAVGTPEGTLAQPKPSSGPDVGKKEPETPEAPEPVAVGASGVPSQPKVGGGKKVPLTLSQRKHIVTLRDAGSVGVKPATAQAQKPYDYFVKNDLAYKTDGGWYVATDAGVSRANDVSPPEVEASTGDLGKQLDAMVENLPSKVQGDSEAALPTQPQLSNAAAYFTGETDDPAFDEVNQDIASALKDGGPGTLKSMPLDDKAYILDTIQEFVDEDPELQPVIDWLQADLETTPDNGKTGSAVNAANAGGFPDLKDLKVTGNAPGTTGPKFVSDSNGNRYVMKDAKGAASFANTGPAHLKSEMLADSLYQSMGATVPDFKEYVGDDGGPVKVAKFVENGKTWNDIENAGSEEELKQFRDGLADKFAVDAWMATWDVIGVGQENPAANVFLTPDGKTWRIDNGGALLYKGTGGLKGDMLKPDVPELQRMRKTGPGANVNGDVFGHLSDAEVAEQIERDFTDEKFDEVFDQLKASGMSSSDRALMENRWHYMRNWAKTRKPQLDGVDLSNASVGEKVKIEGDDGLWPGTDEKVNFTVAAIDMANDTVYLDHPNGFQVEMPGNTKYAVKEYEVSLASEEDVAASTGAPSTGQALSTTPPAPSTPTVGPEGAPAPGSPSKVKAFPPSHKQPNVTGASLSDLNLQEGDVVQMKKGGWDQKVVKTNPAGSVLVEGINTGKQQWLKPSQVPHKVAKADGSKLTPAAASEAAQAPSLDSVKANMVNNASSKTAGDMPAGTVIESPSGKVLIKQPGTGGWLNAADGSTANVKPDAVPSKYAASGTTASNDAIKALNASKAKAAAAAAAPAPATASEPAGGNAPNDAFAKAPVNGAAENLVKAWSAKNEPHTPEENSAISGYTNGAYQTINSALRNPSPNKKVDPVAAKRISNLDRAISKAHPFEQDILLSRRVAANTWSDTVQPGDVLQDLGYISASTQQGKWHGPVHLKILAKKGQKGLWVNSTGGSNHPGEREVLLPRGTMFRVVKKVNSGAHGSSTTFWVEIL